MVKIKYFIFLFPKHVSCVWHYHPQPVAWNGGKPSWPTVEFFGEVSEELFKFFVFIIISRRKRHSHIRIYMTIWRLSWVESYSQNIFPLVPYRAGALALVLSDINLLNNYFLFLSTWLGYNLKHPSVLFIFKLHIFLRFFLPTLDHFHCRAAKV